MLHNLHTNPHLVVEGPARRWSRELEEMSQRTVETCDDDCPEEPEADDEEEDSEAEVGSPGVARF